MPRRPLSNVLVLVLVLAIASTLTCATAPRGAAVKYPPRRAACALRIFHGDLPELPAWDDLGLVEVICHIDETEKTCFGRMRAEACRMGGDVVYHMPRAPWRPRDQAMGFRGKVAHTRPRPEKNVVEGEGDQSFPPPASPEESAGPVIPLTGPAAPGALPAAPRMAAPAPRDGGAPPADAALTPSDARPLQ